LERISGRQYGQLETTRTLRFLADHLKAAVMICRDGVLPSNKTQGYILRRLLRRSLNSGRKLGLAVKAFPFSELVFVISQIYADVCPDLPTKAEEISRVFAEEAQKFDQALKTGIKEIDKASVITGQTAFSIFESFGLPFEIIEEMAAEKGFVLDKEEFEAELKKHQELSRQGAQNLFRGGLADQSYEVTKLHTATHLLHAALRKVLGDHVRQEGSNITAERLRFDFRQPTKLTLEQLQKTEDLVNEQIQKSLAVSETTEDLSLALSSGATAFFREKYPPQVKVYAIGDFSREICGGPHVKNTAELGRFKIVKEEAVGEGVRRIRAVLVAA